ncbi:MAG: hypothetical protein WCS93_05470 [Candidatus Delongbacteria bacterium]
MKFYWVLILCLLTLLQAETLFEVKDSANNKVLDVSTDGLRVMNEGDTLMVISADAIRANIGTTQRGLSRSFSVTTTSSVKGKGLINALEVDAESAYMTSQEGKYTDFSAKNIFIGLNAGVSTTLGVPYSYSGMYNLFIGNYAGQYNTSGYFNTFTGYMAGHTSTTATHNTFYGYQAGMNNDTGSYNTAIGYQAGYEMSGGYNNNVMGYRAGYLTSSGHDNVFIGTEAGRGNSSGNFNVALGYNSGYSLNNGSSNIFMGNESGVNTSSGNNNIFLGFQSGLNNTLGHNNIFMGYQAGYANNSGTSNQFMGFRSGMSNTTGSNNMFEGYESGENNTTGYENLFLGYRSGNANTTGIRNVCLGAFAGHIFTEGNNNVMIGRGAGGYAKTSSSNNVFIGNNSGGSGTYSGNIFIGNSAGYWETGSNKLYIDNSDTSTPLIYGDFATDFIKINGKLGVGINPLYKIHAVDETTNVDDAAVYGKHAVTASYGIGVQGEGGYRGVYGTSNYIGIYGIGTGTSTCYGIYGNANVAGTGIRYGVYGTATGGATNYAGYFSGNVYVTGNLNANDYIEFKSDHPTDPGNKILTHSSVSSSEMLNVYSGNVILDGEGNATLEMPEWFESYNAEFRYQLTGIGSSAPGLYISDELNNGRFGIAGGNPGMKVSWMVTAVRDDNYAKANPMQVVSEKKEKEKGYYLTPEVFGRSKDRSIESLYEREAEKERVK